MNRRDFLKQASLLPFTPFLDRVHSILPSSSQDSANVILILFDTLSACHLSLYGYRRETTPNLTKFAEQATVYHSHYASGNFTVPGTASLLTGTDPWTHRAFHLSGKVAEVYSAKNLFEVFDKNYWKIVYPHNKQVYLLLNPLRKDINLYLDPTSFSLEGGGICCRSILRDTDISFRTFDKLLFQRYNLPASLFLSLISEVALMLCWNTNLKRFSNIYPIGIPSENETLFLVEDVVNGALNALSGAQEPFLAYLHFYPPHAPYRPRREFVGVFDDNWMPVSKGQHFFSEGWSRDDLNQERTRYDEYIAHVDAEFGRMYESLEENGLTQNSYIIITSDHGELFERGVRGHSTPLLYEPVIRVPLLISKPGQQEREDVHAPTSCIDVLPTLLHATGQPVPDWCEGELLPDLGGTADSDRSVFSVEAKENPAHAPLRQGTVALRRGDYKLIHYFGYSGYEDEYELYDLEEDPEELHDLYSSKTSIAAALRHQLKAKLREVNRPYLQGD